MIRRGFTGTRKATPNAKDLVLRHLLTLDPEVDELVVGCCIGMDAIIGRIGHELGFQVHGILPFNRSQVALDWMDWCTTWEEMPEGTNYFQRNDRIVAVSVDLTAFPIRMSGPQTGGTWSTIRRGGRKVGMPIKIIPLEG